MNLQTLTGTALHVSPLAMGTANWSDRAQAARLYDAYRGAGGNFFDCAHIYACWRNELGLPERLLGEFLRQDRGDLVIATKGGHPAFKDYPRPDAYLSAQTIRSDIDQCRERLDIEQLDLFYLHRDDPRMGVDQIMDLLAEEVARGSTRYLGASNWTVARLEAANAYAGRAGKPAFVISQPMWNLGALAAPKTDASMVALNDRPDDIAWHARTRLAVACYTPTAQGFFSGKTPKRYENELSRARRARCETLAEKWKVTPGQVALAWLRSHPFDVFPILGTTDLEHLRDALGAAALNLDESTREWIANG